MSKYIETSKLRPPLKRNAIASLFCVLILFYLAFHAVSGERGVFALLRETNKLDTLQTELINIKTNRELLEKKIKKISNNSLDLDLLDEQARLILGTSDKDEIVIFLDKEHQK